LWYYFGWPRPEIRVRKREKKRDKIEKAMRLAEKKLGVNGVLLETLLCMMV